MRGLVPPIIILILCCAAPRLRAVDPVPESKQGALALKVLDAYHGKRPTVPPKKLHVVYFTPADREPEPRYCERLDAIVQDIRQFYRDGMEHLGFGPEAFDLVRDAEGKLVMHLVKGGLPESSYAKPDSEKVVKECQPVLKTAGVSFERETVLIFCNLAKWDEQARTFSHHSPYYGVSFTGVRGQTSGLCFALDSVIQNLADVPKKEPILDDDEYGKMSLGKFNTIFIGGVAHELGHALSLPHCGERPDEKARGTSLMGIGNHTYREERRGDGRGSILTMASAMRLAGRPLFTKSDRGLAQEPRLDNEEFQLSTNVTRKDLVGRKGLMRVEGTVKGSPPIYGVIAYFDSTRDGGYHAPTATAVPDAKGRFAIEISDLAPCRNGEFRLEFCHANGAVSARRSPFRVTRDGQMDLEQWQVQQALGPLVQAVLHNDRTVASAELGRIEKSEAPEFQKVIAKNLVGTLQEDKKRSPAEAGAEIVTLPLGDARPEVAQVGWLTPAANRVPLNKEIVSPLLDAGKIYATGLYAHSPSRYVFDLGGKWTTLRGEAGLHTLHQPYAFGVVFIIEADGKELFRSPEIRGAKMAPYKVDLTGVKKLELIVDKAGERNGGNWALWLDPTLLR